VVCGAQWGTRCSLKGKDPTQGPFRSDQWCQNKAINRMIGSGTPNIHSNAPSVAKHLMFSIRLQFVLKERIASRQIGAGEILTDGFPAARSTSAMRKASIENPVAARGLLLPFSFICSRLLDWPRGPRHERVRSAYKRLLQANPAAACRGGVFIWEPDRLPKLLRFADQPSCFGKHAVPRIIRCVALEYACDRF